MARTVYLPCKERVERRIVELLQGISVDNGFNSNLHGVSRERGMPRDKDRSPELFVWFGDFGPQDHVDGNASVEAVGALGVGYSVWSRRTSQAEFRANLLQSDIRRALCDSTNKQSRIYVASGTPGHQPVPVDVEFMRGTNNAVVGDEGGVVGGFLAFRVSWREVRTDDLRFYDGDTPVAEEI